MALGALAGLGVVVLLWVLGELLDNEIWLEVWVLVWEMEVVARKVIREVPRETMIRGMWVLRGVVAVIVGWRRGPLEGNLLRPRERGLQGLGLVVVPRGRQLSQRVAGVGVVRVGLEGARQALVGASGVEVPVRGPHALGVVVGGQALVLV